MTIDKLILTSYKYSIIYIVLVAIISYIITLDYIYPLGALVGGVANLLTYSRMNTVISRLEFGKKNKLFKINYSLKYVFYTLIMMFAIRDNYYSIVTTVMGLMTVKIAIILANIKVGDVNG